MGGCGHAWSVKPCFFCRDVKQPSLSAEAGALLSSACSVNVPLMSEKQVAVALESPQKETEHQLAVRTFFFQRIVPAFSLLRFANQAETFLLHAART